MQQNELLQIELKRQDDERKELLEQIEEVEIEAKSSLVVNSQKVSDLEEQLYEVQTYNQKLKQELAGVQNTNEEQNRIRMELQQNLAKAVGDLDKTQQNLQLEQQRSINLTS